VSPSHLDPTADLERAAFAEGIELLAGVDEVGRGAWAGPVSVGVAVLDRATLARLPPGIRDSKLLAPARREALFPLVASAVAAYAVGHASHAECDELGMTAAQRLACERAFAQLPFTPDRTIVDGKFDYTRRPEAGPVVGADRTSVVVAAASVLAKVTRDRHMTELAPRYPEFFFASNKGYPSPDHMSALGAFGLCEIHRRSWSFAGAYGAAGFQRASVAPASGR
jgi:ribonuclease HII